LRELQNPVRIGRSVGQKVLPSESNDSVFFTLSIGRVRGEANGLIGDLLKICNFEKVMLIQNSCQLNNGAREWPNNYSENLLCVAFRIIELSFTYELLRRSILGKQNQ
jgi:hypothetical protein